MPVYGSTLHSLYKDIERRFIISRIDQAEGELYQENYGLHFQLFLDEDTKKKREDDNYTGLGRSYFLSDIRLVSKALDSGKISEELLHYINILGNEKT